MSDYRRLISYLYAYEGGNKGKNMGYAKIEVRDGQCRIQVCVKKVYVGSNDIGVYLLAPGREIQLGRIFIRNGTGEFRIQVKAEDIEASGHSMDECYGLTIHDVESAWQSYTTIWEDAVAQAAEIQLAEVTAERVREREEEPPKIQQEELPVSEEIERELAREQEQIEKTPPWSDEESGKPVNESQPAVRPVIPDPEDLKKLEELDRQEREHSTRSHLWNRLQNQYTKVCAFDYANDCEILSIKPQDIGMLPREIWIYGNNSFLLHGYYNYRHLILARLDNPGRGPRYLLGVPGHYFSNEKYMANMFGFPHFVLAKKQPNGDGRFGYWYTDIQL